MNHFVSDEINKFLEQIGGRRNQTEKTSCSARRKHNLFHQTDWSISDQGIRTFRDTIYMRATDR